MKEKLRIKFSKASLKRIDVFGILFLLAASILLVFALEQGGTRYEWNSATIVAVLVLAGLSWIAFALWEYWLERSRSLQEPIFPLRLLKIRILVATMTYSPAQTTVLLG